MIPSPSSGGDAAVTQRPSRGAYLSLAVLTAIYCLNIADRFLASTFLESIKHDFALSDAQVGLLTGSGMAVFFAVLCVPLGALADRLSRRNLIAVSLVLWSLATILSGVSRGVVGFFTGRALVGIGEAGGTPASFAMLADEFPARRRGMAMSIFAMGASIGGMIGSGVGALIADALGWRMAFVVFGIAGFPLALLLVMTVAEPVRGVLDEPGESPAVAASGFADAVRFIAHDRALMHLVAGATMVNLWGWGLLWWMPAYLMRVHHLSLAAAGGALGVAHGIGGTLVLASVALVLARADHAIQGTQRVLLATLAGAFLVCIAIFVVPASLAVVAAGIFTALLYGYAGPMVALIQAATPATMRGRVFAIVTLAGAIANLLLAPVLIGALSDWIVGAGVAPAAALRTCLLLWSTLGVLTICHFVWAVRHMNAARSNEQP